MKESSKNLPDEKTSENSASPKLGTVISHENVSFDCPKIVPDAAGENLSSNSNPINFKNLYNCKNIAHTRSF